MVADAAFAEHAVYTGFVEHFAHCGINAREYNLNAFGMRGIDQNLEVVDAGGVDEGHLAHAQDSHAGLAAHGLTHEFVEFCGDSEKERAVDFIYLHSGFHVEHLVDGGFGTVGYVELRGVDFYLGVFHHSAQEKDYCEKQTHFDGDSEVKHNRQEESNCKHRDVGLWNMARMVRHPLIL